MQTDPISDMLTRIRNAANARHARVELPASRLKIEIARVLKEEGYISTYKVVEENKTHKALRVFLKYTPDRRSVITGRISSTDRYRRLPGRAGHQHPDDASRRDDRPPGAQGTSRRGDPLRSLVA